MPHTVFVSYSSKDEAAAFAVRDALEAAGLACWVAPRQLEGGSGWAAGIVDAIKASRLVVLLFSRHSNESPQVVREIQCAVSNRITVLPVRIEDLAPNADMEYFLGTTHWHTAFPAPIGPHLPGIVVAAQRVLAGERNPWRLLRRYLPGGRLGIGIGVAAALAVALALIALLRTPEVRLPQMELPGQRYAGKWKTTVKAADGSTSVCYSTTAATGNYQLSASCPFPLSGERGLMSYTNDGTFDPQGFRAGKDVGTYMAQPFGGAIRHGVVREASRKRVLMADSTAGEIEWRRMDDDEDIPADPGAQVLPQNAQWPLENVPEMTRKATSYIRKRWKPDAQLLEVSMELTPAGTLSTPAGLVMVSLRYWSPGTQEEISYSPGGAAGDVFSFGPQDREGTYPIPGDFLDLPAAIAQARSRGMRANQINKAILTDHTRRSFGRYDGWCWELWPAFGDLQVVPAAALQR